MTDLNFPAQEIHQRLANITNEHKLVTQSLRDAVTTHHAKPYIVQLVSYPFFRWRVRKLNRRLFQLRDELQSISDLMESTSEALRGVLQSLDQLSNHPRDDRSR